MQAPVLPKPRLELLDSKPPPNYVAGLGRGATGFTTRSDIGPARAAPEKPSEEGGYDEDQKFDEFEGNDAGLFASAAVEYGEDDKEADAVWEKIEKTMDCRRKDRREARLKEETEKRPKITDEFADLKRKLVAMSADEWDSIPEISSIRSNKKNKKRFESFVPVPDTLLEKARLEKEHLEARDLTSVGAGRAVMFSLKFDGLDTLSGSTVVDPKGYLTEMNSVGMNSFAGDVKKHRAMLKSLIETNPKHPPGWLAMVALEKEAGRIESARKWVSEGCENCPKSEDLWIEASRVASPDEAKAVMARAVKAIPNSVNLWLRAAELEHEDRVRVLQKGLEHITDSVRIWKALIEMMKDESEARVLLRKAVESCPLHLEFWLALARLEAHEDARAVLVRARQRLPKEPMIWIAAAQLEEANGHVEMVDRVIQRGVRAMQQEGLGIDREAWMKEAETAERAASVATCRAIIRHTVCIGIEDEDRKRTWVADADECEKRGSVETARAIYDHALTVFVTKKSIWIRAAQLEKSHGTKESLDALLQRAVRYCPKAEVLWLMGAKEKWLAGDVPSARAILQEAHAAIPDAEEIWLAAFKLEFENNEPERARLILSKARERGGTERVWMKSAIVERELRNVDEERKLLEQGVNKFPRFFKLWLMLGQLEERLEQPRKAKKAYELGLSHCPHCTPIWISLANLEERTNGLKKARAVLTQSRNRNPQNPELWLAAVRAEMKHGNKKEADILMGKALQECPESGLLWAVSIEMAPRPQRKTKCKDAWAKKRNDPHVAAAVGKLFWIDRKVEKARAYLETAVTFGPDIGDLWALYYKFELQHGVEETQRKVVQRCVAAEPKYGEIWQAVAKAVVNSHQPVEAILKKVAVALGKECSASEELQHGAVDTQ